LANAASRGGNILLNIGPKGDGSFDQKDGQILDSIGNWLQQNAAAVFGTQRSTLPIPGWGVATQKDQTVYLHVFDWPKDGKLLLGGLETEVKSAYLLADETKKKLNVKRLSSSDLRIDVPALSPDGSDAVLVLELNAPVKAKPVRLLSSQNTNRFLSFDALLHGKAFGFGDGKTDRYFVDGWKTSTQFFTWELKTLQASKYKVLIRYLAPEGAGGTYLVQLGDFKKELPVLPLKTGVQTQEIGIVNLKKEATQLKISPVQISGTELMKLLEIQLVPVP
jgi:hypothetical protein